MRLLSAVLLVVLAGAVTADPLRGHGLGHGRGLGHGLGHGRGPRLGLVRPRLGHPRVPLRRGPVHHGVHRPVHHPVHHSLHQRRLSSRHAVLPALKPVRPGFGGLPVAKGHRGSCPPRRPFCPRKAYSSARPQVCKGDFSCGHADKCCYDACLELRVCKPAH
ncbi:hypothetical protein FJT64_027552 [Amphibalanus amphitrite]|uniref:WAP domain-containing protein n=1 Tax=Amphibalanus amphitrite TaxID=1232801 RepID=A0A6A4W1I3_AMPAM|nr:hypothetical protein FJT64_027552 [Amphibalanus amphitrite]